MRIFRASIFSKFFGGKINIFNIGYFDDSETIIRSIPKRNLYTTLINEI